MSYTLAVNLIRTATRGKVEMLRRETEQSLEQLRRNLKPTGIKPITKASADVHAEIQHQVTRLTCTTKATVKIVLGVTISAGYRKKVCGRMCSTGSRQY